MDASALLTSQGWRGKGHSLHKTDDSIGLAKPLLLNRKDNTKGLGTTQHFTSDQWWMNAFDEQLKGLETSKDGKVTQTIKTGKLNAIEKGSLGKYSLYLSFVRGGFLEGTLPPDESSSSDEDSESEETPATSEPEEKSDKDDKKARKEEKRRLKEEKAARRKAREEKRAKKEAKRREEEVAEESKEQRRARKAEKLRAKEQKARDKAERRRSKEERRARKEVRRREQSGKTQVACC